MEFRLWFLKIFGLWSKGIFILQQREIEGYQRSSWETGRHHWIGWETHMAARFFFRMAPWVNDMGEGD